MEHDYRPYSVLRRGASIAAVALVLALLPPASSAGADVVFTFEGGGFGHSVGMSQYGAYGMARDGYTWQEIVTHYFTGTTVAAADPIFTEAPLWVGITQEKSRVDFVVKAIGPNPVPAVITRNGKTLTAQPGETITIKQIGSDTCRIATPQGNLTGSCTLDIEWDGWAASPTSALQLQGCTLPDWNAPGGTVFKPCTYARGTMHIRPDNNTQTVDVALEIDVEDYVLGISESPYGWGFYGGMAALEAQAVAARSYAIHRAADRGDPESRPWCWCQIYDTPVDQNYVGWGHGTQNWIDAVRNTEDMVLTHPSDTYQGKLLPIEAFYSSSTFGSTEDSEHGFTAYVPYLRSVDDHWALDPAVGNHSARWTREFSGSSLASLLPGMSTVTGLQVTACSDSGAALEITFTGSGGPRTFTTGSLRGYLGLRSMQIIRAGSPLPAEPACPQPVVTPPAAPGGPVVLAGMTIDDDTDGDSVGNGDGIAQCGEIIEVFTTIKNKGDHLTGIAATLSSADPYVSVRWNTTSTYPDLRGRASATNDGDWDLTIAANAPTGHRATLSMRVTADNGGPWDLEVALPVACRTVGAAASIGIDDLDGNGFPDIVTAVRARSGRLTLKARDAETGAITGRVRLGRAGWNFVDLTPVPGSPSRIAALVTAANGTTWVVVADLATGKRVASVRFGRRGDPVAVAVVPKLKRPAAGLAVLVDLGGGRSRIAARTFDGTFVANRVMALDPIDLERLDDLGATRAAEVAVLGTDRAGIATTITLDLSDGTRFATTSLSAAPAVDLEALRGPGSDTIDTLAVLQQLDGEAVVTLIDPVTGEVLRAVTVPVAGAVDLEITPPLDGGEGEAVAVFGLSPDGVATAIVADPNLARLISGPVFASGTTPIDLAVLVGYGPSGMTLAALGSTSASKASIVLRDAISGVALGRPRAP